MTQLNTSCEMAKETNLDLSRALYDPDMCEAFIINRNAGHWQSGRWVTDSTTTINAEGLVNMASPEETLHMPEGDRITGNIAVVCEQVLYGSRNGTNPGISDQIIWNGEKYGVFEVHPYPNRGYYKAVCHRTAGD